MAGYGQRDYGFANFGDLAGTMWKTWSVYQAELYKADLKEQADYMTMLKKLVDNSSGYKGYGVRQSNGRI